jgi:hypothetical protein
MWDSRFHSLEQRLLAVEEAVKHSKTELPWQFWIALLSLMVVVLGAAFTTWDRISRMDERVASMPNLQERLTSAFQAMRNNDASVATLQQEQLRVREELDGINQRTIEGTDDRWRRRDDEARMAEMQRYLDAKLSAIDERLEKIDARSQERDRWWQAIWASGALKGLKP